MAYTTAQLRTFFTNANAGTAPSAAQTAALTALSNQNSTGSLTDAQALAQTIDLASDSTTAVSVGTYQFFTGTAPSQAGLAYLNQAFTGTGIQANLNGENRFIAQSVALALGNSAAKTAFTTSYGSLTIADATKAAYNIIVGNAAATAAGINVDGAVAFLTSAASIAYYTAFVKANVAGLATAPAAEVDLAVKAAIVGEILYQATVFNNGAGVGSYATATTNLIKDLADDGSLVANNTAGINLFTAYGSTGPGTPGTPGQSFALKVGLDALVGTANDDTFVATLDAAGAGSTTLNFGDAIDGGSGTDTLNILSNVTTAQNIGGLSLKSVENVVVTNTVAGTTPTITVDASGFSGVSKIAAAGVGNLTVTNIGSVTLGVQNTITNGTVGTVADGPIVKVDPTIVTQTITASGATSADVTGAAQNAAGNLKVDVSGGSATAFTLRNTGGTAAAVSQLALAATTKTLNVAATSAITLNGLAVDDGAGASPRDATTTITGTGVLEAINVTGVGAVSLGTLAAAALKTVDASGATGGLTASFGSTVLTSVKGSTAADTLTLTGALGATAVVDLGAGNDTLTLGAAPNAAAVINGGDGTDTLALTASVIVTSGNKAQFQSFEVVQLSGTSTYSVNDLSTFGAINVAGGTVVLNDVGANATFNVVSGTTASLTTNLTTTTGTADTVNLNLGVTGKSVATVTAFAAAGVENLNLVANTGSSATATNALTVGAGAFTKVAVSGAGQLSLTATGLSQALNVDASANTGGVTLAAAGATKVVNFIGTNANDTVTASASGGLINTGKGGDLVTLDAGVDTVILKAGDSSLDLTAGVASGRGGKSTMDTINAFTIGNDKIDLTQIAGFGTTGQGVATATVGLGDNAGLTALLATANVFKDGGGLQRGVLDITGYAANTHFLVVDVNHDGNYTAGTDLVVKLVAAGAGNLSVVDFNFGS